MPTVTNYRGANPETPCGVIAAGGATGTQSGAFVDACDPINLNGDSDPETAGFTPDDYPQGWRQLAVNGFGGQMSMWVVLLDTNGALQWHQTA